MPSSTGGLVTKGITLVFYFNLLVVAPGAEL